MATRERAVDRGRSRGREILRRIGAEIRLARRQAGLTLKIVGKKVGISASELSRIERGLADWASLVLLAEICAVLGLDLNTRAYPRGSAMRDAAHIRLLEKLRTVLHADLRWAMEVPFPNPGDLRAWDALIRGEGWRYGVEAEINPIDGQALIRKLRQKQNDGMVGGLILLMPDTRQTRAFRREFAGELESLFPTPARLALSRLSGGLDPGGNALLVL